jgi:hypothetical protein
MAKTEKNFERGIALRGLLMKNPTASMDDIRSEWPKHKQLGPLPSKEKFEGLVYAARAQVKNHWGVDDIQQLDGMSMTKMIYRLLTAHPDWEYERISKFLAQDGLKILASTFGVYRRDWKKAYPAEAAALASTDSPDENQLVGPRKGKKGRRKKQVPVDQQDKAKKAFDVFSHIEGELDKMLRDCDTVLDSKLRETLRQARRMAGAKVLQLS